ncbi:MAG: (Fe-S)-binding protein [Desulfobacteraceae bacterium]|uniref:(Fe-S)-binding protein n=1 Tax=Candidatus Desulfacyla euxinica TaxID=2841693 RepID=A0A8J6MZV8_9DELT|nr:(Fe-S)-binding protein [Candidatus Desulfacyla euxinica]MBL6978131.1 (Fe-S)-binding protein [Desulfobacteraceae bacterium]MBL7216955.1 (Fe-S)-binding protein [Desulfobacteraceae bacterium]
MGAEKLNLCMQCGMCAGSCPWRIVDGPFNIRRLIRMAQLGVEGYESDDILYGCTTCNKCVLKCPRGVTIIDVVRAMRAMIAETGAIPGVLRTATGSVHSNGNPWSEPREKRTAWMEGLDVPIFDEGTEYLLFVCCTSAYEARGQNIAKAMVKILSATGVSFGVIGEEESCCSESMRKIGDEELFMNTAEKNIKLYKEKGVKKIIATSPHCYYTFTKEYPEFGGDFEVVHYIQLLAGLLEAGKLKLSGTLDKKVTYHDPCYLGRHNDIYDEPRALISAVTGGNLVEMKRVRNESLCCGAGGGRLWMETKPEWRFSDIRIHEACETGAPILATACPYCISMLEDSRKTVNKEDEVEIKDISELIAEVL